MATLKQRKLAQAIVANALKPKPETAGALLEKVGYSVSTSEAKPGEIINSPGVQEELSILGFTEDNAKAVTAEIMLNKAAPEAARLKAAEMTFKVHGSFQPEDSNERPRVTNIFNNPVFEVATRSYERSIIDLLRNAPATIVPTYAQERTADEGGSDEPDGSDVQPVGSAG